MQCYVMMIPFTKKEKCLLIIGSVGLVLTIISLTMALYGFPKVIASELRKNIVLEEGNEAWDRFLELPFPIQFKVYLFNLENGADVLVGKTPKLKEIGPFVYKQYRHKTNVTVKGEQVSFYQIQHYEFDREATPKKLSETMTIKTINALQLGMFQILEKTKVPQPFKLETVLEEVFDDNNLVQTAQVNKLLFDGIDFCKQDGKSFSTKFACLMIMLLKFKMIEYKEDLSMSYSVFGFKNNKNDGYYTMNTGTGDIQKVGSIEKWEGLDYTKYWNQAKGMECDKVEGLDSTIYPPYIKEGDTFKVYSTDLCRSAAMSYVEHSKYRDTDTYRFKMDKDTFYPKKGKTAEDSCFCIKETRGLDGEPYCYLDGLIDVQSCLGIPAVMSLPHFLHADKKYLRLVEGIKPDESKHESEMDIQPYTGFPTRGYKRAQINLVLRPSTIFYEEVETVKKVKPAVLPVAWIEEGVEINDEYYGILTSSLFLISAVDIGKWVFVGITVILFSVPNILFLVFRNNQKKKSPRV